MNNIVYVGEHSRTYDVRRHSHSCWELVYCTGGTGTFHLENGSQIHYRKGQAVAIPPNEVHMNSSSEGFTNIHLTMDSPAFPYKGPFSVEDDAEDHMGIAFAQARFYYMSDLRGQELVLSALGDLIASYMIVFRDNQEFSGSVEHIRAAILRGYADPSFQLDEEIRRLPFSYDYLRKLFQKEMGITPLRYVTDLRMKKARSMLAASSGMEYSMAEVAESCGFGDPLYFSRVFKKYYGCSPSEFLRSQPGRRISVL